mmetsp:Transcript_7638/g.21687  ORF Transcript_7638/g.21687 Transcript_7638/m.21687 type:complete len:227 (-) Transcript_7638:607-1287(-)
MFSAICHTWRMLSSATDAMTHSSFWFQLRSEILAVWPPWTKRSSGGPSSWSSASCSAPMRLRSHTLSRRSAPQDASTVSFFGDQETWNTSSVWLSNTWSLWLRFRMSCRATVLSALPVARIHSLLGLKARQFTSASWASTVCHGSVGGLRMSQTRSFLSSPTEPNRCSCLQCHATSSTTPTCEVYVALACRVRLLFVASPMSQRQIWASSEPLSRCPSLNGLHDSP